MINVWWNEWKFKYPILDQTLFYWIAFNHGFIYLILSLKLHQRKNWNVLEFQSYKFCIKNTFKNMHLPLMIYIIGYIAIKHLFMLILTLTVTSKHINGIWVFIDSEIWKIHIVIFWFILMISSCEECNSKPVLSLLIDVFWISLVDCSIQWIWK